MRGRQVFKRRGDERIEVTMSERRSNRVGITDKAGGLLAIRIFK
jgi:hypothetical protein